MTSATNFDLEKWRQRHYQCCGVVPLLGEHEMYQLAMRVTEDPDLSLTEVCAALDAVDYVRGACTVYPDRVPLINRIMGRRVLVSDKFVFNLPWPNRLLSPNVPGHWAAKAKAKKAYRTACKRIVEGVDALMPSMPPDGAVRVSMRFCPPDKRARDLDNLLASMKSGLDGVADAMGVNDSLFRPAVDWGPVKTGGVVEIQLEVIA